MNKLTPFAAHCVTALGVGAIAMAGCDGSEPARTDTASRPRVHAIREMPPATSARQPPESTSIASRGVVGPGEWAGDTSFALILHREAEAGSVVFIRYVEATKERTVLDVLRLPLGPSFRHLVFMGNCKVEGSVDGEVIAYVPRDTAWRQLSSQATHAWRANRSTRRFEVLTARQVTCEDVEDVG
jgi:hypothetical protein